MGVSDTPIYFALSMGMVGAIVILISFRKLKEVNSDERSKKIEDKSAKATLITLLIVGCIGSTVIAFYERELSLYLTSCYSFTIVTFLLFRFIYAQKF